MQFNNMLYPRVEAKIASPPDHGISMGSYSLVLIIM